MSIQNLKLTLSNSLLSLMDHYKFKDITTNMICAHGNISRSTFYRHFSDKHDLLFWELDHHLDSMVTLLPGSTSLKNYYIFNYTFMYSKQDYFKKLLLVDGQNSFEEYLFTKILTYLTSQLQSTFVDNQLDVKTEYLLEIFAKGLVQADIKWIKSGFKETPEVITNIVCATIPSCLRDYFSQE